MAGSVPDAVLVPPWMDDAMVRRLIHGLGDLHLVVQLLGVTIIAAGTLIYMKGPEGEFVDLFLTADQQAIRLYENKQYVEAAELFEDPAWKGTSLYKAGDYAEAVDAYGRMGDAVGFFNRGNAFLKAFEYRKAITAYEQAVADKPDWVEAQENLELARYTVDYIERSREQGDTGEEQGIGADDTVYDNEGERGADTEVTRESAVEAQSAEKWMRSVDTETADFLRSRFLLEAHRKGEVE